jgi:two-component system chemotaxis sensor kinase CheA
MGVAEVGRLAHACEHALAALAAETRVDDADALDSALDRAAATLIAAFRALAAPDASGARVDAGPLDEARQAIEQALAGSHPVLAEPQPEPEPAPGEVHVPVADDRTWTPTVDDEMVDLFMDEANERLEGLSQKLLQLEARPGDIELLREIFRDLHTMKGSSGMVGLRPMNKLAHAAEDLVGQLRDGTRHADRPAIDALLGTMDGLRAILAAAQARAPIDIDLGPLIARVKDPRAGVAPPPVPVPVAAPVIEHATAPTAKQTLRVDFDKLDLLLNLVGELVLSKAGLSTGIAGLASLGRELETDRRIARRAGSRTASSDQQIRFLGDELGRVERVFQEVAHDLDTSSNRLDRVSAELRDQVMKLRMVPIGGVFRKYHRTVRDLAHTLGKHVRLELRGEDTELDKILVEQLDDPLLHLVRNSVDHGIEQPDARAAAGKDPEGVVRLTAYHRGNQIVIEISDDGGGMDPQKLRAKAREKGVLTEEELANLDDAQLLEVIFRPGFSTAAKVSEVSGRGVGMDVVKDTIVSRMKGTVEVASEVGKGSTFTLRLPLTLAIIQVLLARAAGEIFALPLDMVSRTLTCAPTDVHLVYDREVLATGDEQVPLIRLAEVLELDVLAAAADDDGGQHLHIALVEVFGKTYGLVCDRLLGRQEIVIKRLGDLLEDVPCAAGATLLGDHCALIVDIPAVVARATSVVARIPARAPVTQPHAPAPEAARVRILLVEDSDTIRRAMQRMLENAGYAVTPARDGVEGFDLAQKQDFDLVSTDVMMPNMDGYELTRALRASQRHRDTPIIMVTSRGEKIDRVRGFDAGVDEYITKPHDRQDLLKAVAKHLPRKVQQ